MKDNEKEMAVIVIPTVVVVVVVTMMALRSRECRAAFVGPSSLSSFSSLVAVPPPAVVGIGRGGGRRSRLPPLAASSSSDDDDGGGGGGGRGEASMVEAEKLRRRASELRAEARAAEIAIRGNADAAAAVSGRRGQREEEERRRRPAEYTELGGSCWEMTYRFANEPESDDEEKERPRRRKVYGGKVRIRFRPDGFSDILPSPTSAADDERIERIDGASFDKVWGWDLEEAASADSDDNDDDDTTAREYLLFAADVRLPPPISAVQKFYFQARVVNDDDDGVLSLKDGSVTVKRDVGGPGSGGGWWGVFRGGNGILARFMQVGEFRCRPIRDS